MNRVNSELILSILKLYFTLFDNLLFSDDLSQLRSPNMSVKYVYNITVNRQYRFRFTKLVLSTETKFCKHHFLPLYIQNHALS